jgi:hypothetical protein
MNKHSTLYSFSLSTTTTPCISSSVLSHLSTTNNTSIYKHYVYQLKISGGAQITSSSTNTPCPSTRRSNLSKANWKKEPLSLDSLKVRVNK